MTRKRLGSIDKDAVSTLRSVAEKTAADRRGGIGGKTPPIAQVAGGAARSLEGEILRLRKDRDMFKGDAEAWRSAQTAGLVIVQIDLDQIDDHAYTRDRRYLDRDGEAWHELKDSLRARGQQTPIEVTVSDKDPDTYRLVSGFRRLSALRELRSETGEDRFATVMALVTDRPETVDAMVAMVEENEIRQDVSFYERGRICCLAVEHGVVETVDDAIQILFANSSRNRRYKIRNFTLIHQQLAPYLDYPEAIGERLGARLAQALKEGRGEELTAVLTDRGEKFADASEETALLGAFIERKGVFAEERSVRRPDVLTANWEGQGGLRLSAKARGKRVTLDLSGLEITDEAVLEELLIRIGAAAET
ncbi:ParB N-terminal domain-containing protein [Marinovum sp. 2_MG-2023]|uniref:ParB N-terminal domain-containing protein n=1 Tax=unclassified Marinovum TaxID=2647166 RepID=UPI0026E121E0|nr:MULTISPECIES: ParB N-terminal domain-containing protein [unclassified Marinovum]MDO6732680.1 ParB N-terminal domain-containing protein [Marinovum sp. 2_MG-2023]MDO6781953.1 ParB N-terminal domain-containing protein [Marinovum sp. 1_MG-2023]